MFTERKSELAFSRGLHGAARIFPEAYEACTNHLPPNERHDPCAGYYKLVTSPDYQTCLAAAKAWNRWDLSIMKLIPDKHTIEEKSDVWLLQHARMETHYAVNGGFMEDGQLFKPENLSRIKHIPCRHWKFLRLFLLAVLH